MSRGFLSNKKRKTIAVLKCLGAGGGRIILVYLLQILTLGLLGSGFGVLLAQITLWFAKYRFGAGFAGTIELRGAAVGGVAGNFARRFNFADFFGFAAFAGAKY